MSRFTNTSKMLKSERTNVPYINTYRRISKICILRPVVIRVRSSVARALLMNSQPAYGACVNRAPIKESVSSLITAGRRKAPLSDSQ